MNLDKLYIKEIYREQELRRCKLCDTYVDTEEHEADCPGRVLESLRFEIRVQGPNCLRGGCGYTETSVGGASFEAIAEDAVRAGRDVVPERVRYEGRIYAELPLPDALIEAARARIAEREAKDAAERAAKVEAAERAAAYANALTQLEHDRPDLSEAGYARRKAQIEEQYGPCLTPS